MTDFSDDDRQAFCDVFERLLGERGNETALRKTASSASGFDAELWSEMAKLGLCGIMIGTERGGMGGTIQDAEALMEVAGAALYGGPFLQSCILAPTLLQTGDVSDAASDLLERIATGEAIVTVAGCGASGDWTAAPDVNADAIGHLTGDAHFVSHARNATHAIVVADQADAQIGAYIVALDDPSVLRTPHNTDDTTTRLGSLRFNGTPSQPLAAVGPSQIKYALQVGLAALAGEQAGATRRIFDITIQYLNTRYQFGQPIGRFQALKHIAADLLIEVESASTVARHAAKALAARAPHAPTLAYLAGFTCADNFRLVAAQAIQLHGGIAYTMEHPAHLYWRRAQTGRWLFAPSDRLRDLYLTELEATL